MSLRRRSVIKTPFGCNDLFSVEFIYVGIYVKTPRIHFVGVYLQLTRRHTSSRIFSYVKTIHYKKRRAVPSSDVNDCYIQSILFVWFGIAKRKKNHRNTFKIMYY